MKKITFLAAFFVAFFSYAQDMVITGVFDGPLTGGTPKVIEIYVINNIADMSTYGVGSPNNGAGTGASDVEFPFPADAATAGDFIYISTEQPNFNAFFGFDPTYTSNVANNNGDDAIELYNNVMDDGTGVFTGTVFDVFGDVDMDGTGEPWEYLDGWAYRVNETGPDGATFVVGNFTYSGIDENDDDTTQATATNPWPIGTYVRSTAGVADINQDIFQVFPNPSKSGFVNISSRKLSGTKKISVFDVLGKQVINTTLAGDRLDISSLNSGVYILKIEQGNASTTKKLVVN